MAGPYIRKARMQDVKAVHKLLMECSGQGLLLPRPLNQLYGHLREFFVVDPDDGSPVVGCCGLAIAWDNLAEVRSLAVDERMRGAGFGRKLVDACLSEAVTLGIYKVFTLTYQDNFFRKMGFVEVTKDTLPQKVWADCINCPKFPECDEIAMQIEL
jgi:amino-acid N-acetyltransferase